MLKKIKLTLILIALSTVKFILLLNAPFLSLHPPPYIYFCLKYFVFNVLLMKYSTVPKFLEYPMRDTLKYLSIYVLKETDFFFTVLDIAHGNFTPEEAPTTESPIQSDVFVEKNGATEGELPVSTAKHDDPTYMAIVIGVLTAVILSLAVAIFLIVSRHRQRKCFASPMTGKAPSHLGSTCATVEKGAALMAYTLEDDERYNRLLDEK